MPGVAWDQRAGDAEVAVVLFGRLAEQVVGIAQLEREAENGRDRGERDPALPEVDPDVQLAVVAPEHLALRRHRGGVATSTRLGQREARHLGAVREARQITLALLFGAVVHEEFGRAERVRHHDRDRERIADGREARDDGAVRGRREAEAAVLLRDDHPEEALVLQELPDRRWEVAVLEHLPVVGHAADLLDRALEERAFLAAELVQLDARQVAQVGLAAEQLAVDPRVARGDRGALGVGDRRQDLRALQERQDRGRQHAATQRRDAEDREDRSRDDPEPERSAAEPAEQHRARDPEEERHTDERRSECRGDRQQHREERGGVRKHAIAGNRHHDRPIGRNRPRAEPRLRTGVVRGADSLGALRVSPTRSRLPVLPQGRLAGRDDRAATVVRGPRLAIDL
jgi:hypothetical protein